VLSAQGITRGSGAPTAARLQRNCQVRRRSRRKSQGRLFSAATKKRTKPPLIPARPISPRPMPARVQTHDVSPTGSESKSEPQAAPAVPISPFVSENDVRRAMTRSEKIFIGPKTILTHRLVTWVWNTKCSLKPRLARSGDSPALFRFDFLICTSLICSFAGDITSLSFTKERARISRTERLSLIRALFELAPITNMI